MAWMVWYLFGVPQAPLPGTLDWGLHWRGGRGQLLYHRGTLVVGRGAQLNPQHTTILRKTHIRT